MGFLQEWHIDLVGPDPLGGSGPIEIVDAVVHAYRCFPDDLKPRVIVVEEFLENLPIIEELRLNGLPVQFRRHKVAGEDTFIAHMQSCDVEHRHSHLYREK